jgi:hypothetical protein
VRQLFHSLRIRSLLLLKIDAEGYDLVIMEELLQYLLARYPATAGGTGAAGAGTGTGTGTDTGTGADTGGSAAAGSATLPAGDCLLCPRKIVFEAADPRQADQQEAVVGKFIDYFGYQLVSVAGDLILEKL